VSYILDALKKAAEQRGTADRALLRPASPAARTGSRRLQWIVAGLFLVLNLGALAVLLRPGRDAVAPVPPVPPAPTPRVSLIQDVVPPPPMQVIEPGPARRPAPVKEAAVVSPAATPPVSKPPQRATPRPTPDARGTVTEPRVAPVTPVVPPPTDRSKLKLEVLSYSDVPAQRLVFINGRRYREGDTVDGGAKVVEIREDGVVLLDQGQRFTLR
jgi:general secretion pathway protein B